MLPRREGLRIAAFVLAMFAAGCGGGSTDGGLQSTLLSGSDSTQQEILPLKVNCRILTQCLDLNQASVSSFKGGKKAAASYTFDDGYPSSFAIADMFEARGLRASFYIIAGAVADDQWASWQDLLARGHEIGNHSMTHTIDLGMPDLTPDQLNTEIVQSQKLLADKLGSKPLVFAFPWHSSTPQARALALQTHIAIRTPTDDLPFTLAFFDLNHGTPEDTMATVNQQLADMVDQGGWYVAAGHGIDGDGWSPVSSQFLNDHLDYAQGFGDDLWIDTFVNVARYQVCRKQAALQVDFSSSSQVRLSLNGNFDPACTEPLTVQIPTLASGISGVVVRDASGTQLPVRKTAGIWMVDVLPGQTVSVVAK